MTKLTIHEKTGLHRGDYSMQAFIDGQATQCIGYIRQNGARWWHTEYKPLLLKKWGARRVAALVKKMEMVKNEK